jgi:hypothetical protein
MDVRCPLTPEISIAVPRSAVITLDFGNLAIVVILTLRSEIG